MSEPVRAQEIRLSAVATRNPLSDNSLLTLVKNGSTAPPLLPVCAAGSSRVCVTIVGPLNPILSAPCPRQRPDKSGGSAERAIRRQGGEPKVPIVTSFSRLQSQ